MRPFGAPPAGSADLTPPGDASNCIFYKLSRDVRVKYEGPVEPLGLCLVAGLLRELGELAIGYRVGVHVERIDDHLADGPFAIGGKSFFGFGSHQEPATLQF